MLYRKFIKRIIDFCAASFFLILLSPIYLVLSFLIFIKLGSPVIFSQSRGGFQGTSFKIYKFRTMTNARDAQGNLLSDAERLTRFGLWLRKTSLDELPSLFNVLKGDISLVGPRPLLVQYLPLYSLEQARRHEVLPGITGWAQVNGRNAISWEDKFKLDVWYVDHVSFLLDMKILFLTFYKVIRRADISEAGEATASLFTGKSSISSRL